MVRDFIAFPIALLLLFFTCCSGRQLLDDNGASLWILSVSKETTCDEASTELLSNSLLKDVVEVKSSMKSSRNCFIRYAVYNDEPTSVNQFIQDEFSWVLDIEADEEMILSSRYSWALDRIDQIELPLDKAQYSPMYTGKNITVYVLDTGITLSHPEFEDRAQYGPNFSSDTTSADLNGHGTHVASSAVGMNVGVAPEANVVSVKVLNGAGSGSTSSVIQGIQYVIDATVDSAAIMSMSLGGGRSTAMNLAVQDAYEQGNIVVVAAGNDGGDACYFSPASEPKAVTVGATSQYDTIPFFSNYGTCVDIYAPGQSVIGASNNGVGYTSKSGTSMATPHVAGALAGLMQKHSQDRDLAVAELNTFTVKGILNDRLGLDAPILNVQPDGKERVPTPQPSQNPTYQDVIICFSEEFCPETAESIFGKQIEPESDVINAELTISPDTDGTFCVENTTTEAYDMINGKVVLIKRGDCLFFTKVKNAERIGAVGVIFYLADENDSIFPANYYGIGTTDIPSAMVSKTVGDRLLQYFVGKSKVHWGRGPYVSDYSDSPTATPTTGSPTTTPTISPTSSPTTGSPTKTPTSSPTIFDCSKFNNKKRKCKRKKYCNWRRENRGEPKQCYLKNKFL